MKTSIGRIVIYKTTEEDREKMTAQEEMNVQKELPAVVVAAWTDDCVNLKVFGDGKDNLWKTSVVKGDSEGDWHWPVKV